MHIIRNQLYDFGPVLIAPFNSGYKLLTLYITLKYNESYMRYSQRQFNSIKWLTLDESGEETGPLSTQEVLVLISEKKLKGEEKVRKYPDGEWIKISVEPVFYDKLLEILEQEMHGVSSTLPSAPNLSSQPLHLSHPNIPAQPPFVNGPQGLISTPGQINETNKSGPSSSDGNDKINDVPDNIYNDQINSPQFESLNPNYNNKKNYKKKSKQSKEKHNSTVELSSLYKLRKKKAHEQNRLGVIFLFSAALLILGVYFFSNESNFSFEKKNKDHLISTLEISNKTKSTPEIQKLFNQTVPLFLQDTFESYYETQVKLVNLINAAIELNATANARGLLCLTYKELWPYVKQDSNDFEALNRIVKQTKSIDPVGINGIYCDIAKLLSLNKIEAAKGIVNYALSQNAFATDPILFELKSEILSFELDYQSSNLYLDRVLQYQPTWIKPFALQGKNFEKLNLPSQSAEKYSQVLKQQPNHYEVMISYGVLLSRKWSQKEEAFKYLTAALAGKNPILRSSEAEARLELARIHLDRNEKNYALKEAKKAYFLNPANSLIKDLIVQLGGSVKEQVGTLSNSNVNQLIFLGDQYFKTGDYLSAQAEYKSAYEIDPHNGVAAMNAAKCLWQLNQGYEAIKWMKTAITSDNKLIDAYLLLADYLSTRYNYVEAQEIMAKAAKIFPKRHEVLRGLGMIEYRRNNYPVAIQYLEKSFKKYENDVDTLVLLAQSYGGQAEAGVTPDLREEYLKKGQAYILRAIELDGTHVEAQIVYAKILSLAKGIDSGLQYLNEQIARFSYSIDLRLGLAQINMQAQRFRQSQVLFEQVLVIEPKNKKALIGLGDSYQGKAQFDLALKSFISASILDPSDAESLFKIGLVHLDSHKYKEAIKAFQKVIKVNPLYPMVYYHIGKAAFLSGDFALTLEAAKEEKKQNPNVIDSYILAAETYTAMKDFNKCTIEYQSAIKLKPKGAHLYVKIARCFRQSGNADVAESMLSIAANQESGYAEIYKEQGAIFEQKGDKAAAYEAYNKYLGLSPNAPDKKHIEDRMSLLSH